MPFIEDTMVHLGAEAEVWKGEWFGHSAIRKQRRNRSWRHPDLDYQLGVRRLISESRILLRLHQHNFPVPFLYDVDVEGQRMVMEYVDGAQLLDILNDATALEEVEHVLSNVGRVLRMLHRLAITHGDLSTNNILIEDGKVWLIDFGLASVEYEVERFGIDLHVLDEILGASHPHLEHAISVVTKGYLDYEKENGEAEELDGGRVPTAQEVLHRLDDIRARVRYHG